MVDHGKTPDVLNNLMAQLGEFGPYQRWQCSLHIVAALLTGIHMFSLVTIYAIPEHRCEIPNVDINRTMTDLNFTTLTKYIPLKAEKQIDSCHIYNMTTKTSMKCSNWVYNKTYYSTSRAIEWTSVCDRKWMGAISQTVFMLGIFWGDIFLGNLADKVGRKPVYCWTILLSILLGVGIAFTSNYYVFLAIRFLLGLTSCAGAHTAGFVMAMELVGPSKRTLAGMGFQFFFTSGIMLVAFWGWLIKDRQLLQIIYSLHGLPMILNWWLMDESPRWLWASGRYQECLEILQKALLFNGSTTKLDIDNLIPQKQANESTNTENTSNLFVLFRKPNLRKRILNVGLCWFANSLVYYGLSMSTGSMGGNPFLLLFLMAAIESPGFILLFLLLDKIGRRSCTSFNMVVSGFCCILAASMTAGSTSSIIFVYLGKFLISCSFSVAFLYTAELFPTVSRTSAVGFSCMCARFSASLAPLINLLDSFDPKIPCILFGIMTIFSGCLTMFLPETVGTHVPSAIDEGEKFGLGDNCFTNFRARRQIISDRSKVSTEIMMQQFEPLNVSHKH